MILKICEEAGLDIILQDLQCAGKLAPAPNKPSFEMVYLLENYTGPDPAISRNEHDTAQWLGLAEFTDMLRNPSAPTKSAILPALNLVMQTTTTFG